MEEIPKEIKQTIDEIMKDLRKISWRPENSTIEKLLTITAKYSFNQGINVGRKTVIEELKE